MNPINNWKKEFIETIINLAINLNIGGTYINGFIRKANDSSKVITGSSIKSSNLTSSGLDFVDKIFRYQSWHLIVGYTTSYSFPSLAVFATTMILFRSLNEKILLILYTV